MGHKCLVYGNLADPTKWVCRDGDGQPRKVNVSATITATSGDFLCEAAVRGLGVAMQPTFIAGEAISRGDLIAVLTESHTPAVANSAVPDKTRLKR